MIHDDIVARPQASYSRKQIPTFNICCELSSCKYGRFYMETAWVVVFSCPNAQLLPSALAGAGQLRAVIVVAEKVMILNTNLFVDWTFGDWSQRGALFIGFCH